ncbi:hypothetical protein NSA19_12125 [Actinomyces bowdenii]|uniref:hypothetical protein n=1 Tax=Actinomyces bowdenii TaxID=131109 RepID=UPI00214BC160|nr:hypothetical protein [Actinomyces bowdenii]MCR2053570.1 hypothetical protein [Actinomyces bowdenii]
MNRIAFSMVILAIITFIGGILWLTSTSVAGKPPTPSPGACGASVSWSASSR